MSVKVMTRDNAVDGLDIKFTGCTAEEAMAVRNALSDRTENRSWALKLQGTLMEGIRASTGLTCAHNTFKTTIRDVDEKVDPDDFNDQGAVDEDNDWME